MDKNKTICHQCGLKSGIYEEHVLMDKNKLACLFFFSSFHMKTNYPLFVLECAVDQHRFPPCSGLLLFFFLCQSFISSVLTRSVSSVFPSLFHAINKCKPSSQRSACLWLGFSLPSEQKRGLHLDLCKSVNLSVPDRSFSATCYHQTLPK